MNQFITPKNFDWANISDDYANSILEIKHSYDIKGESIELPANIILKFNGGRFSNYNSIKGNNTKISANLNQIFDNDTNKQLSGYWSIKESYPQWFGAVGDAETDDTDAIQCAINLSLSVYFPTPKIAYKVTSPLIIRGGQKITGSSKSNGSNKNTNIKGIWGNMSKNGTEIFQLGDGKNNDKRKMTFYNIYAYNNNGPVVKSRYCSEFVFFGCELRSQYYHCIDTQQSYLFSFYNCSLGASGSLAKNPKNMSVVAYLMDNSNGVLFSNCRISGGSSGGVARIGQSYNLKFDGCVFESSKYGIYIGDEEIDKNLQGAVHSMAIIDCQWEQCYQPLNIGLKFTCLGIRIEGIYISNYGTNIIKERDVAIKLGRVKGAVIKNVIFELAENEYAWEFIYNPNNKIHLTLENCDINNITYKKVSNKKIWKTSGFKNKTQRSYLSKNKIQLLEEEIGEKSEYISERIDCTKGTIKPIHKQISKLSSFGGQLLKVEILDAFGDLSGYIYIGHTKNQGEYLTYDLSTAKITDGYCIVYNSILGKNLRAEELFRLRVIKGDTEGSFRLKITYK